jgi:hypothetical protein
MPIDWGSRETIFRLLAAAFAVIGKEGVSTFVLRAFRRPTAIAQCSLRGERGQRCCLSSNLTDNLNSLEARTEKLRSSSASRQHTMLYSVSFEKSRRWPTVSVPDKLARQTDPDQ